MTTYLPGIKKKISTNNEQPLDNKFKYLGEKDKYLRKHPQNRKYELYYAF